MPTGAAGRVACRSCPGVHRAPAPVVGIDFAEEDSSAESAGCSASRKSGQCFTFTVMLLTCDSWAGMNFHFQSAILKTSCCLDWKFKGKRIVRTGRPLLMSHANVTCCPRQAPPCPHLHLPREFEKTTCVFRKPVPKYLTYYFHAVSLEIQWGKKKEILESLE